MYTDNSQKGDLPVCKYFKIALIKISHLDGIKT